MEHRKVIGYRAGNVHVGFRKVCVTLTQQKEGAEYEEMFHNCNRDNEYFQARRQEATRFPNIDAERVRWNGVPVRHCPAFLESSPSSVVSCLVCRAIFLNTSEHQPRVELEEERRQAASKPTQKAMPKKSKAAPPIFKVPPPKAPAAKKEVPAERPARAVVKMSLPEVTGVVCVWCIETYDCREYVIPTKRQGDTRLGTGGPSASLDYSSARACGTHENLNGTFVYHVSKKNLSFSETRGRKPFSSLTFNP